MTFPNHLAGGLVFTGLFSSLLGWNIFSSPVLLVTTLVCSVLPDIDTPNSIVGRKLSVSRFINRKFGHRTFTHSFLFIVCAALCCSFFSKLVYDIDYFAWTVALALFSHTFFDMMTVAGVEFMYPFSRSVYVLPANPRYRLRVKDFRSEFVVFVIFVCSFVLLRPLFYSGFWESYNRLLGSQSNLYSQFVKSDHLLYATYTLKSGSVSRELSGYVVSADESSSVVFDGDVFRIVPGVLEIVTNVDFVESEKRYQVVVVDVECIGSEELVFNCNASVCHQLRLL